MKRTAPSAPLCQWHAATGPGKTGCMGNRMKHEDTQVDQVKKEGREKRKGGGLLRGDLLLLAGVLLFSLFFWVAVRLLSKEGSDLLVSVDGETRMTLPLDRDTEQVIETELGRNVIRIRNGSVTCEEADCPDKLCVKHHAIHREGETIICLPHKLVLEVKGR